MWPLPNIRIRTETEVRIGQDEPISDAMASIDPDQWPLSGRECDKRSVAWTHCFQENLNQIKQTNNHHDSVFSQEAYNKKNVFIHERVVRSVVIFPTHPAFISKLKPRWGVAAVRNSLKEPWSFPLNKTDLWTCLIVCNYACVVCAHMYVCATGRGADSENV